jgi:hypothetical protein
MGNILEVIQFSRNHKRKKFYQLSKYKKRNHTVILRDYIQLLKIIKILKILFVDFHAQIAL